MKSLFILIMTLWIGIGQAKEFPSNKLHVITVASTIDKRLVKLLNTCVWQGINIEILGAGEPYPGNGQKLVYIQEYARQLDPEDIILFVDAYDVLFIANEEKILEKFLAFNTSFLISAEQGCFPFSCLKSQYPETSSPFKYMNSGTFIGYAGFILKMLKDIDINPQVSDQGQLSKYLLSRLSLFSIDYFAEIFLCLFGVSEDDVVLDQEKKNLYCIPTQSFPCIVHANGKFFGEVYQRTYRLFAQDGNY